MALRILRMYSVGPWLFLFSSWKAAPSGTVSSFTNSSAELRDFLPPLGSRAWLKNSPLSSGTRVVSQSDHQNKRRGCNSVLLFQYPREPHLFGPAAAKDHINGSHQCGSTPLGFHLTGPRVMIYETFILDNSSRKLNVLSYRHAAPPRPPPAPPWV